VSVAFCVDFFLHFTFWANGKALAAQEEEEWNRNRWKRYENGFRN